MMQNGYMFQNVKLYTSRSDFSTYISPIRRITPLIVFLSNHENKKISNKIINISLNHADITLVQDCNKDTTDVSKIINALSKFEKSKTIQNYVDGMCRKMSPKNSICEGKPTQVIELLDGLANFSNSSDVCVCQKFLKRDILKQLNSLHYSYPNYNPVAPDAEVVFQKQVELLEMIKQQI
jgi:hypothetical protein